MSFAIPLTHSLVWTGSIGHIQDEAESAMRVCVCVIVWQVDAMITENPLSHILTVRLQHSQTDKPNRQSFHPPIFMNIFWYCMKKCWMETPSLQEHKRLLSKQVLRILNFWQVVKICSLNNVFKWVMCMFVCFSWPGEVYPSQEERDWTLSWPGQFYCSHIDTNHTLHRVFCVTIYGHRSDKKLRMFILGIMWWLEHIWRWTRVTVSVDWLKLTHNCIMV